MPFDIHVRSVSPETSVVTITGPLSMGTNLKTADNQIQTAIEQGATRLVIDLTGVPYVDSAGLGVLIHAYGLASSKHGTVRLAGVADRVAELLHMTQMDTLMPIDANAEASLAALG